jgi:hypothetical protein
MNDERSVLTRRDVAHELLRATGIEILRTQVRRKREWGTIYHGFRPQFLTRSIFLRGAPQFITKGIRLRRDSWVSVMYAEDLNSAKSSVTLQSTDRHGIWGQKSADF